MSEKMIDFPASDTDKQEKLEIIICSLACHFNTQIGIEKVTIMRVNYDGVCHEMDGILKLFADDPNGFKVKTIVRTKKGLIRHYPDHISKLEKDLDPMGS